MLKTVGFPSTRTGDQTIINGNLVIGTAGKGIDFSADGQAAGMTSELLDDYEEGTWTPVDGSGASLTLAAALGDYTKIGGMVFASFMIEYPVTADVSTASISGLPFVSSSGNQKGGSAITYTTYGSFVSVLNGAGASTMLFCDASGGLLTNANMSGKIIRGTLSYMV